MEKKMNDIRAAVFDLDGTLLDTLSDLADSCNETLREFNFPERTLDEVRCFVGNGIRRLMERAVPGGETNADFERCVIRMKEIYAKNSLNKTIPYPGIMEMLGGLKKRGVKIGIVSNKPDSEVKHLASVFFADFIPACAAVGEKESEGVRRKPAPDSVFAVLKNLSVKNENAFYAGDSDVDIATAENAGMPCVSVCWGFRSRDFLLEHGAKILVSTPDEILDLI